MVRTIGCKVSSLYIIIMHYSILVKRCVGKYNIHYWYHTIFVKMMPKCETCIYLSNNYS